MTARLAVVDDDPAFTEFVQTFLRTRGYDVDVYHSGSALLEGLRTGAAPHVILLDVLMPDLDGIETLRAIRTARPSAQVIMLSGRQAPATIVEAVRLGAADYVLKPGDPEGVGEAALESAIRNALERESLSAEVARLSAQIAEDPEGAQVCWSVGAAMQPVMTMVERVADSDVSVLLRGESGVGKEIIARELHRRSHPADQAVREGELRSAAGRPARERAVRSRAGCLHRSRNDCASGSSSSRSAAPSCSTKSVRCRRRFRPSCCTCCRTVSSPVSAAIVRSRWTSGCSPPPTVTSRR